MIHSGTALVDPKMILDKIKLTHGMRVADFGCGRTGHLVFPSAQIVGEDGVVYAVDIVKNILQSISSMAKDQGYENIKTIWSDIEKYEKTPIPDNSLDAIFFVNVLSQLKEGGEAIKEASRLLKKNGFLVIIDWTKKLGILGPEPDRILESQKIDNWSEQLELNNYFFDNVNEYHYLKILQKTV